MQQLAIFESLANRVISIDDAAESIQVSSATIKNWVKTGYLSQSAKNLISVDSLKQFNTKIAGSEKLTSRANKSQKDTHNHHALAHKIDALLEDSSTNKHLVGDQYEQLLSNAYRNKEGIYYTPSVIAEHFFERLPDDCSTLTFCDPCCGSGNFLIAALKKGFKPENIYGFDIDPIAIKIAHQRLLVASGYHSKNIHVLDFLAMPNEKDIQQFDVIFTNPPWGKKLEKNIKTRLSNKLNLPYSANTSTLFLFLCLEILKKEGLLGLLVQESFFNIASFEAARKKALSLQIQSLIDFGKPFKGLLTKARGIILKNTKNDDLTNLVNVERTDTQYLRSQKSFTQQPKSILDFTCTPEKSALIKHLFDIEHTTLCGDAQFALGIVTGNNNKHCINHAKNGYIPAYKGLEIFKDKVLEASCYISNDFSKYQQVAPIHLYEAQEKLIYRFITSDLVFYHDTAQRYVLNSANVLVLNASFPISTEKLGCLLNSKVINWLFKHLFDTHKILKADIETLPIHFRYFEDNAHFSESDYLNYLGLEEMPDGTYRIKK